MLRDRVERRKGKVEQKQQLVIIQSWDKTSICVFLDFYLITSNL